MGRWDENTKKKNLNRSIEKKILRWNNFMMNPSNRVLKVLFFFLTFPTKLIHSNSKCSKFVQKHIIIITPIQHAMVMIFVIFSMFFLSDFVDDQGLRILIYIGLYIILLFFGMARSDGGHRRKDSHDPPGDSTDVKVDTKDIVIS